MRVRAKETKVEVFISREATSIFSKQRGLGAIVGVIAGLVLVLIAIGFAFGITGTDPGDPTSGGAGPGLGGCVLNDGALADPGTFRTPEDIFGKLPADKVALLNSVDQKKKVEQIIAQPSVNVGEGEVKVNPALLLAIWYGEQKWSDKPADLDKAFGYGIYKGSRNRYVGFDDQLAGAINAITHAINNDGAYTLPTGENQFTRLFFTYTGAMKDSYTANGYVAASDNPRIQILNYLVPDKVTCTSKSDAGAVPLLKQCDPTWGKTDYGFGTTVCSSACGVLATTMVLQSYGVKIDPVTAAKDSLNFGCRVKGAGSSGSCLVTNFAKKYGMKGEVLNWDKAMEYLKAGKPIIMSGQGKEYITPFPNSHFVVLVHYNESDKTILVNDSGPGPRHPVKNYKESDLKAGLHFIGVIYPK